MTLPPAPPCFTRKTNCFVSYFLVPVPFADLSLDSPILRPFFFFCFPFCFSRPFRPECDEGYSVEDYDMMASLMGASVTTSGGGRGASGGASGGSGGGGGSGNNWNTWADGGPEGARHGCKGRVCARAVYVQGPCMRRLEKR